jgi:uncharacterized protein
MDAKDIVASYFDALAKGEMERALSFFALEAKWDQPGRNKFAGIKNNLGEIIKMFEGIMSDTLRHMTVVPTGKMMENAGLVAVPVWFSAQKEGKTMNLGGLDLFEIKEDKIIHVWTFSADQPVDDEFWGE